MNMEQRGRILTVIDRVAAASIVAALLGATLGFGGGVWWSGMLVSIASFSLVISTLTRLVFAENLRLLKSPLTFLGVMILGLGVIQLIPFPARIAAKLSPQASEVYERGLMPQLALADDPKATLPEPVMVRSPATLDRSATLRWLVLASGCLAIFWGVGHFADRMQRLYLVWGCVIAAFLLNCTIAIVQFSTRGDGLFGYMIPGMAAWWAPSADDLLGAPGSSVLRDLSPPASSNFNANAKDGPTWAIEVPTRPHLLGTMMGGPGGFLALGSLALPLAFAVLLHLIAPRGSRETISARLAHSGHGGLAVLLALTLAAGCLLVGLVAGPWYSIVFAVGLVIVGIPSLVIPGARGAAMGMSATMLLLLSLGAWLSVFWPRLFDAPRPVATPNPEMAGILWREGLAIFRDFPMLGVGMGSFPAIHPYYKTHDGNATTAMSSLIQWAAESGIAGLSILCLAALWSAWRILPCLRRVGSADRCLAYGLIGAALAFTLLSLVHWTIELTAVAVCLSALGGTWNRWLAGGTDLFVERG